VKTIRRTKKRKFEQDFGRINGKRISISAWGTSERKELISPRGYQSLDLKEQAVRKKYSRTENSSKKT